MLDLLAQWASGRHGPLVGRSFRHLSSFTVSDSLGSLPHSEAIASVPLVTSWSSFGPLVTSWSSLGATPAIPPTLLGSSGPLGVVPLVSDFNPVSFSQAFTSSPLSGLILSPAADPVPYRLVQRICSGEFVEMRDLLADNIALHDQLEDLHGHTTSLDPRLREVPSLASWVYCFAAYMAVHTKDLRTRDMLAYCRLIIREALRHGGSGWQEYDRTFRRQVAVDPHLPWHSLHPGLQAATVLSGRGAAGGMFCSVCREVDHSSAQCALAVVQQRVFTPAGAQGLRSRRSENICASWNRRNCTFPGTCVFWHVCSICLGDHKMISCPSADRRGVSSRAVGITPSSCS